ncbi:MAG: Calx-beta domain-containing protein, partial [Chloroflexota bacterium]
MKRMVWIAIALWAPICSCLLCSMGDTVSEPRRVVHQFGIDSITLFTSTPTATSTPSTNPVQPPTQQEASAPTPDTSVRRATPTKSPTTPTIPPTRTPPPPTTTALPTSRPSPSPTQPQPFTTATATSLPSNPPDSPNLPNLPEQTPSPSPTPTTIPSATPPNALPEVSFNNSAQQADENNGLVTLNVSLNTPATQPITVTYATHDVTANAGSDYLAVTGLINLTIGQTVVPVSIVITNDTLIEPDEAFQVTLQQASNATLGVVSTSTITIKSDDGLTVNTTDDSDDGSCDTTHCTLREAINSANNNPGLDTILFNIPGGGPYTIRPTSPIPTITESIMVDGLTQPGADCTHWPPTLLIELDGSNAGVDTNGLSLMADDSNIQGLVINRFGRDGIHLQADRNRITCSFIGTDPSGIIAFGNADDGIDINQGANNQIGGASDTDRNLIAANLNDGIYIRENSQFNRIEGNYIGTDATGLIRLGNNGNGIQISLGATANNIGGAQSITASGCSEVCNLISGNRQNGIWIRHNTTTSNSIQSNYIGTTIVGTIALSNGIDGIKIEDSPNNIIGGLQASEGNLISGNGNTGILMIGTTATNNTIAGNYIGTDSTGTVALGNNNDGILIRSLAANNIIGGATTAQGNLISGNHIDGIGISAAAFNNQLQNNYIGTD